MSEAVEIEPFELFQQAAKGLFGPTGVWACGKCMVVHRERARAAECCVPARCACGAEPPRGNIKCFPCQKIDRDARTAAKLAAAEKLVEWDSWIFDPQEGGDQDGYFESIDALLEWYAEAEEDEGSIKPPDLVFVTTPKKLSLDFKGWLEGALEDFHEDAGDALDGEDEMAKLVNEWAARQDLVSYEIDYTRAVRVAP